MGIVVSDADMLKKERARERDRRYREAHPDRRAASNAKWREANAQKCAANRAAWRVKNPGYAARWEAENLDRRKAENAEWKRLNPDRVSVYSRSRRSLKGGASGVLSPNIAKRLMGLQKGLCICCRTKLSESGYHIDHVMPLSKGGSNDDRNVQLLCPTCNLKKHAKHPIDFMQSLGFLL